jgi:four helix bundle protein
MFLKLSHTKMDVYQTSQSLVLESYKVARNFPSHERFSMVQQLRRAALSVHLNLAEGCSRKSAAERKRFFEISRGSIIEIDSCLDLAAELEYVTYEYEEARRCDGKDLSNVKQDDGVGLLTADNRSIMVPNTANAGAHSRLTIDDHVTKQ